MRLVGAVGRRPARWLLLAALSLVVASCDSVAPPLSPGSPGHPSLPPAQTLLPVVPAHADATDGPFHLSFDLPRSTWSSSDPIDGTASLTVSGSDPTMVGGCGSLLGFNFDEIGGLKRQMDAGWALCCGPFTLTPGQPVSSRLTKGGSYSPGESGADFYASFFADPAVHLPPGDWTITAVASFISYDTAQTCHLPGFQLSAPIRVHVAN
jgi:hypothetical protein